MGRDRRKGYQERVGCTVEERAAYEGGGEKPSPGAHRQAVLGGFVAAVVVVVILVPVLGVLMPVVLLVDVLVMILMLTLGMAVVMPMTVVAARAGSVAGTLAEGAVLLVLVEALVAEHALAAACRGAGT